METRLLIDPVLLLVWAFVDPFFYFTRAGPLWVIGLYGDPVKLWFGRFDYFFIIIIFLREGKLNLRPQRFLF